MQHQTMLTPNTSYYTLWMAVLTSHANGLITESKHFAEWFINSHRIGFPAAFSHVHCFYFSLPGPWSPTASILLSRHTYSRSLSLPLPIKITSSRLVVPSPVSSYTHFDLTPQAQLHPCPYICIYSWRNPLCVQTPFSSADKHLVRFISWLHVCISEDTEFWRDMASGGKMVTSIALVFLRHNHMTRITGESYHTHLSHMLVIKWLVPFSVF